MSKKIAMYAGSFDPMTRGHYWVIELASKMFDEVIVAIGENPAKKYTFKLEERKQMLTDSLKDLPNVKVLHFSGQYAVDFAQSMDVKFIIRGIRNERDYGEEKDMRYINYQINPSIETVFLIPPKHLVEVSSSFLKQMIGPKGWERVIQPYVTDAVYVKLLHHYLLSSFQVAWSHSSRHQSYVGAPSTAETKAKEVLSTLIDRYLEPHRYYHNLTHILDCLHELNQIKGLSNDDYAKLAVAIWFHDVVYDTKAKDNEKLSSELFDTLAMESKWPRHEIVEVINLILATQTHVAKTPLENYMLDIDLSILGASAEDFERYDLNIRKEYSWVPEQAYTEGRAKVMNEFASRPRIFQTETYFKKLEEQAKKNLSRFKS